MINFALTRNDSFVRGKIYPAYMPKRLIQNPELASALKILRMKAGFSLKEIEPSLGVTRQAISRWENGTATFPDEKVSPYLRAIGKTQADLDREINFLAEEGASYLHKAHGAVSGAHSLENYEVWQVQDEAMSPWCSRGEPVYYDRNRQPKRHDGCMVELIGGRMFPRFYLRDENGTLYFEKLNPPGVEHFRHDEVTGIYKIFFRGT